MKPDSSGKKRLISGRATSSVTRPPPPSLRTPALDDRALVVALDVLQPRLHEQRPERPVDHPRVPVPDVRVRPDDDVAAGLVERLPERLALAAERPVARQDVGVLDDARARGRRRSRACRRWTRSRSRASRRGAARAPPSRGSRRRHDRPDRLGLVERRQDQADGEALLLLERDEAAQVGELARGGSSPRRTSARRGPGPRATPRRRGRRRPASRRAAASCSNVWRPIGSRVLTTMTDGLGALGDRLGQGAEERGRRGSPGGAEAPMTTRSRVLGLAQDRRADVARLAQDRLGAGGDVLATKAASACSACARTASVTPAGTRWSTATVAPWRWASASANRRASSAWGPPRTGTRIRRMSRLPRCFTTAMSQGDSRTTSSMVGEMTVGPGPVAPAARTCRPSRRS